jgi:hypothetical protein
MTDWIRLADISGSDLSATRKIELVAAATEWLALAWAMVIIHGDRAAQKLVERGCPVRFDDFGEPIIWTG